MVLTFGGQGGVAAQVIDYSHGFDADGADAAEQVDDAVLVVGETVGVEPLADGGVAGFALLVLVEDPFEGGAAAELVSPGCVGTSMRSLTPDEQSPYHGIATARFSRLPCLGASAAGYNMPPKIPHPFPYQGSKRNIARQILRYLPAGIPRLIEPFCGSAAISIAAAANSLSDKFMLNDIDAPLMELWSEILDRPTHLCDEYERIWHEQHADRKGYFLRIRTEFNANREPHHLLYLLARIVKGSVRYSSGGTFNQAADNRRLGMRPAMMRQQIHGVAGLLAGRTCLTAVDFRETILKATTADVVYLDPPYQGTSFARDHRYISGVSYNELVDVLALMNIKNVSYIMSYDGRTGDKEHGKPLPSHLNLRQIDIHAGKSSQATLMGKTRETVESLYLSPSLLERLGTSCNDLPLFSLANNGTMYA